VSVDKRTVAAWAGIATVIAGALAAPKFMPQAFADEPQSHLLDTANEIFAPKFDPKSLQKFDIALDDSVSSEVSHRELISKIAGGHKSIVSVVTTPTGTYSSDALVSPNVQYPGIDVTPKDDGHHHRDRFVYGSATTPWGTQTWSSVTVGSFTYFRSNFERART